MLGSGMKCANRNHPGFQRAFFAADDGLQADHNFRCNVNRVAAQMRRGAMRANAVNLYVDAIGRGVLDRLRSRNLARRQFGGDMEGEGIVRLWKAGLETIL